MEYELPDQCLKASICFRGCPQGLCVPKKTPHPPRLFGYLKHQETSKELKKTLTKPKHPPSTPITLQLTSERLLFPRQMTPRIFVVKLDKIGFGLGVGGGSVENYWNEMLAFVTSFLLKLLEKIPYGDSITLLHGPLVKSNFAGLKLQRNEQKS